VVCFERVHNECGLYQRALSVMMMVCYVLVCYEHGLLWIWSVMNRSVMNVVCFQMWSVMNMVCYERGLLWMWSVMNGSIMNMVCYEGGLSWTGNDERGLLWTWSVMNAVCYERVCNEQVCYERGLFWVVCCDWSYMKGSVLKRNHFK